MGFSPPILSSHVLSFYPPLLLSSYPLLLSSSPLLLYSYPLISSYPLLLSSSPLISSPLLFSFSPPIISCPLLLSSYPRLLSSHLLSSYPVHYWMFKVNWFYLLKCLESIGFSSSASLVQTSMIFYLDYFIMSLLIGTLLLLSFSFLSTLQPVCPFENANIKWLENANIFILGIISCCFHPFL